MKLTISPNQLNENTAVFLRRIGYTQIRDRHNGQESFARRLSNNFYPRFHCYTFNQGGQITFNLHLDQRPTRYEGQTAHAGEYDSGLVQAELDRIQAAIAKQTNTADDVWKKKNSNTSPSKKWWPFG